MPRSLSSQEPSGPNPRATATDVNTSTLSGSPAALAGTVEKVWEPVGFALVRPADERSPVVGFQPLRGHRAPEPRERHRQGLVDRHVDAPPRPVRRERRAREVGVRVAAAVREERVPQSGTSRSQRRVVKNVLTTCMLTAPRVVVVPTTFPLTPISVLPPGAEEPERLVRAPVVPARATQESVPRLGADDLAGVPARLAVLVRAFLLEVGDRRVRRGPLPLRLAVLVRVRVRQHDVRVDVVDSVAHERARRPAPRGQRLRSAASSRRGSCRKRRARRCCTRAPGWRSLPGCRCRSPGRSRRSRRCCCPRSPR